MYTIIKVASHFGAPTKGTHEGPDAILASLGIMDVIEVEIPKENPEHKSGQYNNVKNLPEVKEVCSSLIREVKKVVNNGKKPLVFMGDDSSIVGVGYGLYQSMKEPFGIVYLDAHGDINTPETTISGCLFGQGLAHLIGLGHSELLSLNNNQAAIHHDNKVMIGQRNLDPGERKLIQEKNILLFSPSDVDGNLNDVLQRIKNKFEKNEIKNIYLHIDQDVVDPTISGASLCQEHNGISDKELFSIVKFVKQNFDICALSIGNYHPSIDVNKKTMGIIRKILGLVMN